MQELSRRNFIRLAAGGAAAAAAAAATAATLAGCGDDDAGSTGSAAGAGIPSSWDHTADVVVLGAGGAGLAAACAAAEAGADVLVVEVAEAAGGTTAISGGVIQAAGTPAQKELAGIDDDSPARHAQCYLEQAEGYGDEAIIRLVCERAPEMIDWLTGLGLKWVEVYGNNHVPYVQPGVLVDRIHVYEGGGGIMGGRLMTEAQYAEAERLGVRFLFETKAEHLYRSQAGVVGLRASNRQGSIDIKAAKGVILALGGIDRNLELARAYNPQQYWDLTTQISLVSEHAKGDGVRMGLELGAAMTPPGTIDFDMVTGQATNNKLPQLPCIMVNAAGKRFVCEDATYAYQFRAIFQEETKLGGPTWTILDQNMVEQAVGPFAADPDSHIADGRFYKADSIEALASQIGVPASNLRASLELWNSNIRTSGEDLEFGRNTQLIELNRPPYYAHKNSSANLGSLGALKIDTSCQVIDVAGQPIERLYAVGCNAGGWAGLYYPGSGTALAVCLVTGRVAGESAATAASLN